MGRYILHKDGAYNLFSTVVDAPIYERALTLTELKQVTKAEYGESGLRQLDERLERAHERGCSSLIPMSLSECIMANRAGPQESEMPEAEFIAKYLTLPVGTKLAEAASSNDAKS